jgi:hypothetical protein
MSHAFLYRRHQLALDGPGRAALLWLRINATIDTDSLSTARRANPSRG